MPTWIGASGGAWTTSANWSGGVPTASTDADFNGFSGTVNITSGNVRHVNIYGGANVTFATGTSSLNINGDLTVSSGSTLNTTGTASNSIQFTGTAQASSWSPGGGSYARVQVAKSSSSFNINASPTITGQFTFVNGTINQNASFSTPIVANSTANTRTWNMNGYNVTVTNTTGTPYSQSTNACTFGGTRGYFIMQGGATAAGGTNAASAPSISTAYGAAVGISGSIWDLELNGSVSGTSSFTLWGTFYDYATANSTSATMTIAKSSGGTYSYNSYHQWSSVVFATTSGSTTSGLTWNIDVSRSNSLTCSGTSNTYNFLDVTFSTNNTSGAVTCNGTSCTYNFNDLYSSQGTSTQLLLTGSSSTFNLANTGWWEQSINGSLQFTAANGTLNLINDFSCRNFTSSGTTNKTLNFSDSWIIINTRSGSAGTVTITDPTFFLTDMNTTTTGGFILRNSAGVSNSNSISTVARTHAPRIRWEQPLGTLSGNIRELIVQDTGGFNSGTSFVLMVGDIIFEGSVAGIANVSIDLGHGSNYHFDHWSDWTNSGIRFNNIGVSSQFSGTTAEFSVATTNMNTSKSGITINYNKINVNTTLTCGLSSNVYNLFDIVGITTTTTQLNLGGSSSTYNLDLIDVFGNINFAGASSTMNMLGTWDVQCKGFSSSGTVNKTLNANGSWIIINDRSSNSGTVSITDASFLLSNWGNTGFKLRSTGAASFSTLGTSYLPNVRVEAPVGTTNIYPSISGRVQSLYFDNTAGGTGSGTVNIYGNVSGNLTSNLTSAVFQFEGNSTVSVTTNGGRLNVYEIGVNGSGITVNFDSGFSSTYFRQTLGWSNINANSLVSLIQSTGGLIHTGGTLDISPGITLQVYSYVRTGTTSCSLILDGDMECPTSTSISTRWSCADTTNYSVSGNGWVIYRGAGQFNYGQTNNSAINYTTGDNTFNVKILQNISSGTAGFLYLTAVKSFTNHEGTWDQMGRWEANTTSWTMYIFGDFSAYAPPNDNGTYRNKVNLISPRFAGTDATKIHNFGNTSINPGYGGMEPDFSGIKMMSAGTLRCLHNVTGTGGPFQHGAGTVELTSSNVNCTTVFFGSDGATATLDTGTRNWVFPAPNTHFVCNTNFSHATTTGLTCSGAYYNATDPTQLSGVYCSFTTGALRSGSTASTTTPPNFILPNTSTKLISPFYCNGIRLTSDNLNANDSVYVYGMWAPTSQTGTNADYPGGNNVYMIGTGTTGFIDTSGDRASCPITIVDPGSGNTKTVYTSVRSAQTTRIGTLTSNIRTILSGNHPSSAGANVVISGSLSLLGSLIIKASQGWDFSGSGTVLTAASAENITDNGGVIYFSNSGATQATFPTTTINNITRNTTSSNALTITSNGTTINTITNDTNGGGSFTFIDGGGGAPTFGAFNIDGTPSNIALISGPVISSGSTFLVDYATISNSAASPSGKWLGGNGTTDGGGNTGWLFGQGVNNRDNFFLILF